MSGPAEVIVVGGGPAGCAAAIRLAQAGHDVVVLERCAQRDDGASDIASGELMAPVTQAECEQLGVPMDAPWALDRTQGVRNVYPDGTWTYHEFPPGFAYLNVDRGGFDAALRARLVAVGGRIAWGARVTDLAFRPDAAIVRTADGAEWRAAVVIDCAGRHAPSLRLLRLKVDDPEFQQIAVALFFRELPDGAVGFWDRHFYGERGAMISGARIRPGLHRLVLEADLGEKQTDRANTGAFFQRIADRFDPWVAERVRATPQVAPPWAMAPLAYRATSVAHDRLVLAGDATGYLSPLTGQGVELALRMGRLAAAAVHGALARGDCSAAAFAGYVDERRAELESTIAFLRTVLRHLRDRDELVRAGRDDAVRAAIFGPVFATAADRGRLWAG